MLKISRDTRSTRVPLVISLLAVTTLASVTLGSDPAPKAFNPRQGSGIKITLKMDFIDKYASRATMTTDYRVDRVGNKHPQEQDGEVHIAGVALEAKLPTVAELTNPESEAITFFKGLANGSSPEDRTVAIQGVWRLWCEHAGTTDQKQGSSLPDQFRTSNPDHVFEIHPITQYKDHSLLGTFQPIEGYDPKPADRALLAYENTPCRISLDEDSVTLATRVVGFNFVEFVLEPATEDDSRNVSHEVDDGRFVMCHVYDTDGELVARRRRMVFVKGTEPYEKIRALQDGQRLQVVGLPRISLELVQWRLSHVEDPKWENPLEWNLPYELVIIGVEKVVTGSNVD